MNAQPTFAITAFDMSFAYVPRGGQPLLQPGDTTITLVWDFLEAAVRALA
jgi:hypothetical protein